MLHTKSYIVIINKVTNYDVDDSLYFLSIMLF